MISRSQGILCALFAVLMIVFLSMIMMSSSSSSSSSPSSCFTLAAKNSEEREEPPEGPDGQLPREKQNQFMPHGYDLNAKPPRDFDPSKPPPGFDKELGGFSEKGMTDKDKERFRKHREELERKEELHRQSGFDQPNFDGNLNNNNKKRGGGINNRPQYPGGVSEEEIARVAKEYEARRARGENVDDDDEANMVWGETQGARKQQQQRGKGNKKQPAQQPPKGKGKGKKMKEIKHIGEQIRNTAHLESVKKLHSHLVVLYHAPSWPWCESCFALENATRTARLVVDRWASYGVGSSGNKKDNNANAKDSKKKNKKDGGKKKEDEQESSSTELTHESLWDTAPANAAARFAWVDCSASGVHGPFHPCADIKALPALGIFVDNSETPLHWYDSFTDSFSVLSWIRNTIPNAKDLHMTDDMKQEERGMVERKKIERYSSLLPRVSPKEAMDKAQSEPILALLYEQDCRGCDEDTILLETVARFNQHQKKPANNNNNNNKKTAGATTTSTPSGDETDVFEMPTIVRIPMDDKVRPRWLGEMDVPQIAYFDAASPNTPQIYFGQRNATDLLAYTRFISRLDVKVPKLPLNSKAVSAHPNIFGPSSSLRIHSAEELRKYLDESKPGQRLLYVHSSWQRPSDVTSEAGAAVDFFYQELQRRQGPQKVELRVLLLCSLRPVDRNQILDMKLFSRRVSPFFILVNSPGSSSKTEFINMRITRANLAHFGEEKGFLAVPSPRVPTTNVSVGHSFIEFNTLAPIIVADNANIEKTLLLPFDFYSDREDFFLFVASSTGSVESSIANDRGLLLFDKTSREIRRLLDREAEAAASPRANNNKRPGSKAVTHNVSFGVVDISRFPEIKAKAPAEALEEINNGMPVVLQLKRKSGSAGFEAPALISFGSSLKPFKHAPWDAANGYRLMLSSLLRISGLPEHPDSETVELTASNFERIIQDPTMGVLVMFYSSNNDPHSDSMMEPFRKVAQAFKKDTQTVIIAQLDIERLDANTRKDYKISHVPNIRWFPKGIYDKGIGEVFPGTPFTEAMIEFVSEEMNLPYFDLEQMRSGGDGEFPPVQYKDFDNKITNEMFRHVVLYLSRGRFKNEAKLDVLKNMQKKFDNHPAFQNNFTFARIDAIRYNKKLRKSGLQVDPDELPMLVYLPPSINKFEKLVKFPMMERPFAEPTIARWITDTAEYPELTDIAFNYTDDELDREKNPPITGIKELDSTNFQDFIATRGDRVVMFYASWCKASREFMPTFSKVANHFEGDDQIEFGRIDIPQNEEIGHQQGIQAFPTIITYFEGSAKKIKFQGEVYPGGTSGEGMIEYLTTIRQSSRVQALETYRQSRNKLVLQLNETTFRSRVANGNMHALIEFGVDWCGHCRHLEGIMEDLAEIHATNRNKLIVGYVNCDDNREVCGEYNITDNYPKLMLFRRDPLKLKNGEAPKTPPIRSHHLYKDHRFFNEIQNFIAGQIPSLELSRTARSRFEQKRNKEETEFFELLFESKKTGSPVKIPGMAKKIQQSKHGVESNLNSGTGGMPQTLADESPETRKRRKEERDRIEREEIEQAKRDGKIRPGSNAFAKPKFTSFPAHVSLLDYDSFIKGINDNKLMVVLNYEEPEDNDEMVSFSMMAQSLQPMVERGMVQLGAIAGAGGDSGIARLLGRHPSITFFRGLATPSQVRFETGAYIKLGEGGDMHNVTHLLSFVEKYLKGAGKTSYELKGEKYEMGTQDPTFTTVVFFYAPWDEQCRKVAAHYDAVAQVLGHYEHIILTRVDISRSTVAYTKLGQKPLPAIYVYDKAAKDKAKDAAWVDDLGKPKPVAPRYFGKTNPTRDELINFIIAEDPKIIQERREAGLTDASLDLSQTAIPILGDQDTLEDSEFKDLLNAVRDEEQQRLDLNSKTTSEAKKKEALAKQKAAKKKAGKGDDADGDEDSTDIIYMPAYDAAELDGTRYAPLHIPTTDHFHITMREFKQGALIFFTAEYCAHCPKFEDMFHQAVGPMRNRVVVAEMDVTKSKTIMRRCGVRSLPGLVYVRPGDKPGEEDDDLKIVHFTGQKSIEEFVKFGLANVQGLPVPKPGSLPPYPELKPDKKHAEKEENAKDLELLQRARTTAEELITNISTLKELTDVMFSASAPDKDDAIRGVMFVYVAPWCGSSCTRVLQVAGVVANAMENSLRVVVVNVTSKAEFRQMQQAYDVRSVPLLTIRCTGDDGTLKRIQGSQLSLRGPGWVRRSSENIAVLFEGFCMKRYSKDELRSLSSMVPEAVIKELTPSDLPKLRHDTGLLVFIRNSKSCRHSYDCRETQKVLEQAAVKAKNFKDVRAQYIFIDATGEKQFKSKLKSRGLDTPLLVYLEARNYEGDAADDKKWLDTLILDMFQYENPNIPTVELINSFISQQIAREKAI